MNTQVVWEKYKEVCKANNIDGELIVSFLRFKHYFELGANNAYMANHLFNVFESFSYNCGIEYKKELEALKNEHTIKLDI